MRHPTDILWAILAVLMLPFVLVADVFNGKDR